MARTQTPLFDAPGLSGSAYCGAHAEAADAWFVELMGAATDDPEGIALLALGGYGRGELWPFSDLDVILIHDKKRKDIQEVAERLWYPVWDRGLKLGHVVGTVDQTIEGAKTELDRATALLDLRLISGDPDLHRRLEQATEKMWSKKSEDFLDQLATSVEERHERYGDVSFTIEPELKNGRGGLRDLHAMRWADRADPGFASAELEELAPQAELLVAARVELHRTTGRAMDTLTLDDQDAVAEAMGIETGQALMLELASAGRRTAWHSDEVWVRWNRRRNYRWPGLPLRLLTSQFELRDDQIELRDEITPDSDPLLTLRAAEMAARTGHMLGRATLEQLRDRGDVPSEPWDDEARNLFSGLLLAGRAAIEVIEDLDQFDLMVRLLPEWESVRAQPQRNVLHTFTVDRHLCEAAANASELIDEVARPDLLVLGALLHDIGKGYPGDHTEVGMVKISTIAGRMGYSGSDVAVLVDLCRYHLMLSDIAVRRDISDPGTIRAVAAAGRSSAFLRLLRALTEADSKATGPSVWNSWKDGLVRELVDRACHVIEGGKLEDVTPDFPPADLLAGMSAGKRSVEASRNVLTVVDHDAPGMFGRVAAVLALNGLDVLDASAYSADDGMACSQFTVNDTEGHGIEWEPVLANVHAALEGRLALSARVNRRASQYQRYRRRLSADPVERRVTVDNTISDVATVLDVHAPDTIGLLFRITQALAEFRLDIRGASAQTLGPEAVDSFYLCDSNGAKVTDPDLLRELELAILDTMGPEE
jgi:[protein-PII] uridylyltransferase